MTFNENNFWTIEEDEQLKYYISIHGTKWKKICSIMVSKTPTALRNRYQRIEKRNKLINGETITFRNKTYNINKKQLNKCKKCGEIKRGHTCKSIITSLN